MTLGDNIRDLGIKSLSFFFHLAHHVEPEREGRGLMSTQRQVRRRLPKLRQGLGQDRRLRPRLGPSSVWHQRLQPVVQGLQRHRRRGAVLGQGLLSLRPEAQLNRYLHR